MDAQLLRLARLGSIGSCEPDRGALEFEASGDQPDGDGFFAQGKDVATASKGIHVV
jgi:hypothetical protein